LDATGTAASGPRSPSVGQGPAFTLSSASRAALTSGRPARRSNAGATNSGSNTAAVENRGALGSVRNAAREAPAAAAGGAPAAAVSPAPAPSPAAGVGAGATGVAGATMKARVNGGALPGRMEAASV
jgi:hypothetical protein